MFEQFRNIFPLDEGIWNAWTGCFTKMETPAKTILLKEGSISRKIFFIEKGCIRVWFNNNGKDISFQFFFENSVVASIESFRKQLPSPVAIETIEPSVLWRADKKDIDRILEEVKQMSPLYDRFIDAIFERTFEYMRHFLSFIKDSPEQRYLNLLRDRPQVVERVPQHYIASYLGISSVHLSRIKSAIIKKRQE